MVARRRIPDNSLVQEKHSTIDALLCAVLRGEMPAWPWAGDATAAEAFGARARLHGVEALLHAGPLDGSWPPELRGAFKEQAIGQAIWELRHQQVLAQVIESLAAAGVQPLLIKGTALAYSLYPDPALRTRADTDLIIPAHRRDAVFAALEALGFERDLAVSGEFVSYQSNFSGRAGDGTAHTLDVHWKFNNSPVLARLLDYDEAHHAAVPLPALHPGARAPNHVHSLLIAAFHRASHIHNPYYVEGVAHFGGDRLVWLYDIHLLARAFDPQQWRTFCALARQREAESICLQALRDAQHWFGSPVPADACLDLASTHRITNTAKYLAAGRLQQQWMDFLALDGARSKWRFVIELLFPTPSYMRERYPAANAPLPWLYLRRAFLGACKTLGQGRSSP